MIAHLCEGLPEMQAARPVQIAEHHARLRALDGLTQKPELLAGIAPALAVVNQAIHPCPERLVDRIGKFSLPPQVERKIRVKIGEKGIRDPALACGLQKETRSARSRSVWRPPGSGGSAR